MEQHPPNDEPQHDEHTGEDQPEAGSGGDFVRATRSDPLFGLLISGAVTFGLIPLIDNGAFDLRYTLAWGMLAAFGVLSWLIGSGERIDQEAPEDLVWGLAFGFLLGVPILAFSGGTLTEAAELLFRELPLGAILAYVVFVMPLGETLFFRGLIQQQREFWETGVLATIWQMILFFPLMNRGPYPLIVGALLLMSNLMYSYVHERNGMAAAWLCQITVNMLLIFIPAALA